MDIMVYRYLKERVKEHLRNVIETKHSPHSIALGFSIGTFIGILPTHGFSLIIAFLIVLIYEKINKYSLFGAIIFWNPIVQAPVYFMSFLIGNVLFGTSPVIKYNIQILNIAYHFTRRYLIGNIILAVTLSILSYFIVKRITIKFQDKKESPNLS